MTSRLRATFKDGTSSHDLAEQEILALLESGEAELNDLQNEPPWILLDILEARLDKLVIFGPEASEPASLKKISDGLVVSGVRPYLVEGSEVRWWHRKSGILNAAREDFRSQPKGKWNVWADAERILRAYFNRCDRRVSTQDRFPSTRPPTNLWLRTSNENYFRRPQEILVIDPEWSKFNERKKSLAGKLENTVRNALISGRIICCEDGSLGARVVPPSFFTSAWKSGGDSFYCLTTDLPKAWFSTLGQLRTRRRDAAKWMNETYLHFQSNGRRAGIGDLKTVAAEKFWLTSNAVIDAWREFEPKPRESGNIEGSKRVKLKEIRTLINR